MREYVWLECTSCGERNYRTPEGDPGGRAPRAEEVLPARAEAHAAQGIAEEVTGADRRVRPPRASEAGRPRPRAGSAYERSSIGRAPVSKTGGWGFDSLRSCSRVGRRRGRGPRTAPDRGDEPRQARGRPQAAIAMQGGRHGQSQRRGAGAKAAEARGRRRLGRRRPGGRFTPFFANLLRADLYKPTPGLARPALDRLGLGAGRWPPASGGSTRRSSRATTRRPATASRRPLGAGPGLARSSGSSSTRRSPTS